MNILKKRKKKKKTSNTILFNKLRNVILGLLRTHKINGLRKKKTEKKLYEYLLWDINQKCREMTWKA